ncbi:unnamed protein product [Lepeophtheirus salmonis]|uniref:(salmon louse) hypothetical protein n=1 Tax=Lepeophtheirus salmonis TaxID=72036 RepID=A0A7R8D411_LEPSM|nr:unnamed protein product [Lepeophtheirus salmonis]CAF3021411.1 unnamed protein product [Lepeophtheirus salmonis]
MFGGKQVIDEGALRNFREFLEIYNQMSELCFNRCIDNLHSVRLSKEESECTDLCAGKHMTVNHKVLSSFMNNPKMPFATNRVIAVLCGLPGSGKTQLITHYKQSKPTYKILHINYDKIIPRHSNLKKEEWKSRRKCIINSLEAYLRVESIPENWVFVKLK